MQRRKLNFQQTEYYLNNELICFGLSSHEVEEMQVQWTPKALHDLAILRSWFKRNKLNDVVTRPVYKSDFNWTNYATRA
jgi:hypothetical protein